MKATLMSLKKCVGTDGPLTSQISAQWSTALCRKGFNVQLFPLAEFDLCMDLQQKALYKRLCKFKAVLAFDGNQCLLLKEVCSHLKAALKACEWAACPTYEDSKDLLNPSSVPFPKEGRQVSCLQQGNPLLWEWKTASIMMPACGCTFWLGVRGISQ